MYVFFSLMYATVTLFSLVFKFPRKFVQGVVVLLWMWRMPLYAMQVDQRPEPDMLLYASNWNQCPLPFFFFSLTVTIHSFLFHILSYRLKEVTNSNWIGSDRKSLVATVNWISRMQRRWNAHDTRAVLVRRMDHTVMFILSSDYNQILYFLALLIGDTCL